MDYKFKYKELEELANDIKKNSKNQLELLAAYQSKISHFINSKNWQGSGAKSAHSYFSNVLALIPSIQLLITNHSKNYILYLQKYDAAELNGDTVVYTEELENIKRKIESNKNSLTAVHAATSRAKKNSSFIDTGVSINHPQFDDINETKGEIKNLIKEVCESIDSIESSYKKGNEYGDNFFASDTLIASLYALMNSRTGKGSKRVKDFNFDDFWKSENGVNLHMSTLALWKEGADKRKDYKTVEISDKTYEDYDYLDHMDDDMDYAWPVPGYTDISDPFGPRICPVHGAGEMHTGTDICGSGIFGADVCASEEGVVVAYPDGTAGGYGNCVVIVHPNGWKTAYAHLSAINVKSGTKVKKGDLIGAVGSTGASTGPHLHWSLFKDGDLPTRTNSIDPEHPSKKSKYVEKPKNMETPVKVSKEDEKFIKNLDEKSKTGKSSSSKTDTKHDDTSTSKKTSDKHETKDTKSTTSKKDTQPKDNKSSSKTTEKTETKETKSTPSKKDTQPKDNKSSSKTTEKFENKDTHKTTKKDTQPKDNKSSSKTTEKQETKDTKSTPSKKDTQPKDNKTSSKTTEKHENKDTHKTTKKDTQPKDNKSSSKKSETKDTTKKDTYSKDDKSKTSHNKNVSGRLEKEKKVEHKIESVDSNTGHEIASRLDNRVTEKVSEKIGHSIYDLDIEPIHIDPIDIEPIEIDIEPIDIDINF